MIEYASHIKVNLPDGSTVVGAVEENTADSYDEAVANMDVFLTKLAEIVDFAILNNKSVSVSNGLTRYIIPAKLAEQSVFSIQCKSVVSS